MNQLSFPSIESPQDALSQLSQLEQDAERIASQYHSSLAKMHAVGDYLTRRKADISTSSFTTFLEGSFSGYEIEYLRKLMAFSRSHTREGISSLSLKTCGKEYQGLLSIPEPRKGEPTTKQAANPAIAANNMQRLLSSYRSRYGGISGMPEIERKQIQTVFRPIIIELATLLSADELRAIADEIE